MPPGKKDKRRTFCQQVIGRQKVPAFFVWTEEGKNEKDAHSFYGIHAVYGSECAGYDWFVLLYSGGYLFCVKGSGGGWSGGIESGDSGLQLYTWNRADAGNRRGNQIFHFKRAENVM